MTFELKNKQNIFNHPWVQSPSPKTGASPLLQSPSLPLLSSSSPTPKFSFLILHSFFLYYFGFSSKRCNDKSSGRCFFGAGALDGGQLVAVALGERASHSFSPQWNGAHQCWWAGGCGLSHFTEGEEQGEQLRNFIILSRCWGSRCWGNPTIQGC